MSGFDSHPNLAIGTIITTPSPYTSGTTFTLPSGQAALFDANMPITIAPAGAIPTTDNAEIGYITSIAGTTITFQRAQEGTTAKSVRAGWKVYGSATAKSFTDIEAAILERAAIAGDLGGSGSSPQVVSAHITAEGAEWIASDGTRYAVTLNPNGSFQTEVIDAAEDNGLDLLLPMP
jgi:hypothetical protein